MWKKLTEGTKPYEPKLIVDCHDLLIVPLPFFRFCSVNIDCLFEEKHRSGVSSSSGRDDNEKRKRKMTEEEKEKEKMEEGEKEEVAEGMSLEEDVDMDSSNESS